MWNASNGTLFVRGVLLAVVCYATIACGSAATVEVATDSSTPEPLDSFFIEAQIQVNADESAGPFPADGPITSTLRWWYEAPDRFRWELETPRPPYLSGSNSIVSDGSRWISYDANLNRYRSDAAIQFPDGAVPSPQLGILIGPLAGGSVNAWVAGLKQSQPTFDAQLLRSEEILGRRVGVYEFSPTGVRLDTEGTPVASGNGRIWFDEVSGLVLKYEAPGSNGVVAEITRLNVNTDVADERFTLDVPAGAIEIETTTGSTGVSGGVGIGGRPRTPPGLLEIGYVPPYFNAAVSGNSSTGQSMGIVNQAETTWVLSDGRALRVRQFVRVTGLPDEYLAEEQIVSTVSIDTSYNVLRSDDGTMLSLAWQDSDVTVVIDSIGVSTEELARMADSIRRPGDVRPPDG